MSLWKGYDGHIGRGYEEEYGPKHTCLMLGNKPNKLETGFSLQLPGVTTGGRGSAGHFHFVHTESSILGTAAAVSDHLYICAALHVPWSNAKVPDAAARGAISEQQDDQLRNITPC